MTTFTIPLTEYLALQRLVGFAKSCPTTITRVNPSDTPPFDAELYILVPPLWAKGLLEAADACTPDKD